MKNKKIKPTPSTISILRQIFNFIPQAEVKKIGVQCEVDPMATGSVQSDSIVARKDSRVMLLILFIVLILAMIGSAPAWPYSRGWGYAPSGGLGTVLLILLILWMLGYVRF
jgi:hypothetical protein